jgi:uncharacterized protein YukE
MPTFKQAIDSEPRKFGEYGDDLSNAAEELDSLYKKYESQVDGLSGSWQGDDYDALKDAARALHRNSMDTKAKLQAASTALRTNGAIMVGLCNVLTQTKRSFESAGFKVHDVPFCWLGMQQQQQVSSTPPPGNAALFATYSGIAVGATTFLNTQFGLLMAQDTTAAAALHTLGLLMRDLGSALGSVNHNQVRNRIKSVDDDPGQRPGTFREDTYKRALDNTEKDPNGDPIDWHSRNPIDENARDTWDMGHPYGYESRKHEQVARLWESKMRSMGLDPRDEVLDRHNEAEYILESTATNRSHVGEAPDAVNYWVDMYDKKYGPPLSPSV